MREGIMGRPPIGKTAITDAERQRRHREKVENDPVGATSGYWLDQTQQVKDALWRMAWVARQRGIDFVPLRELADRFDDVEAVLYDQMWPDKSVTGDSHEMVEGAFVLLKPKRQKCPPPYYGLTMPNRLSCW